MSNYNNLSEREKNYWASATHEDMDKVDVIEEKLRSTYNYDKATAAKLAVRLYLKQNPDKFNQENQEGGRYKKHKTFKRKHSSKKHRKKTYKSRKYKRSRYHRKSKK
jgi:hypothetical protein